MDQSAVLKDVRQFKKALESIHIDVQKLVLFGSRSTGSASDDSDSDSDSDSDMDVVVISSSFVGKDYWQRIDMLTEAIFRVFVPIDALAFTPEEWRSGKSLVSDYAKNGIVVD